MCIDNDCQKKTDILSENNCTVTNIGGFLKHVCFNENSKQYYHVCANSNITYEQSNSLEYGKGSYTRKLSSVTSLCDNDPGVYQACGFSTKITRYSKYLCGGLFY